MSRHPLNLAIRFLLELGAITTYGVWGYSLMNIWARYLLLLLLPLIFALLWGIFAVPNDPSRSGKTVVATPGWIRLLLELVLFTSATWMIFDLDLIRLGWIFGIITLLHYLISLERIFWLLRQK